MICCADEDFGIVPVEAQAAGAPVVAYGVGGHRDSVEDGVHGVLFAEQTVDGVVAAIERLEDLRFDEDVLRTNAARFSKHHFQRHVAGVLHEIADTPRGDALTRDEVSANEPWQASKSA